MIFLCIKKNPRGTTEKKTSQKGHPTEKNPKKKETKHKAETRVGKMF